jgi:hypothetical protein
MIIQALILGAKWSVTIFSGKVLNKQCNRNATVEWKNGTTIMLKPLVIHSKKIIDPSL